MKARFRLFDKTGKETQIGIEDAMSKCNATEKDEKRLDTGIFLVESGCVDSDIIQLKDGESLLITT